MYTKSELNHLGIAEEIYEYLRYEYKFITHKGMEVQKCILTLSKKLQRLPDFAVLSWGSALDEVAKLKSDNAPTPVEIIKAIEAKAKTYKTVVAKNMPEQAEVNNELNYEHLWKSANDKQKFKFFIDHKFNEVPAYVRYWFIKYNREHRGWSPHESSMMISYWKLPFANAHSGAMAKHQYEVLEYFKERNAN